MSTGAWSVWGFGESMGELVRVGSAVRNHGWRGGRTAHTRAKGRAKVLLDAWKGETFNGGMVATLTVKLGERSYPIRFGTDLAGEVRQAVDGWRAAGRKVAVLTDVNLARAQAGALRAMFGDAPMLSVEAGEGAK